MDVQLENTINNLRHLIEKRFGLVYSDQQIPILITRLERLQTELGLRSFADVQDALQKESENLSPRFVETLTIGETYFMRNRAQFEALKNRVLPELTCHMGDKTPLLIWSAGCATGEEPYSLAMWIREYAPDLWPNRIHIVATDINERFLASARSGRYRKRSFRQLEDYWRLKYFSVDGEYLFIDPAFKEVVSFQQHNLVSNALPRGIIPRQVALIFCRNVFIYFSRQTCLQILNVFHRLIRPHGSLFLGHAEPFSSLKQWRVNYCPGAFFYQPLDVNQHQTESSDKINISPVVKREPQPKNNLSETPSRSTKGTLANSTQNIPHSPPKMNDKMPLLQLYHMANKAADVGDAEEALRILNEVINRDRTSPEGYILTALVAEQVGYWKDVRKALKKALFLDKHLAIGHYLLAVLDEREGNLKAAFKRYYTLYRLLQDEKNETEVPFSDGLTAGRLRELVEARTTELANLI